MGTLSSDLKDLGYERTERSSPFHDNGTLWENGYELVCDETSFIIRKNESKWTMGDDGVLVLKEKFDLNSDEEED